MGRYCPKPLPLATLTWAKQRKLLSYQVPLLRRIWSPSTVSYTLLLAGLLGKFRGVSSFDQLQYHHLKNHLVPAEQMMREAGTSDRDISIFPDYLASPFLVMHKNKWDEAGPAYRLLVVCHMYLLTTPML